MDASCSRSLRTFCPQRVRFHKASKWNLHLFFVPLAYVQAYFEGYGPKYVEWLSDWSFNVVFGDPDEARNAAAAKSFGLPEILPKDIAVSASAPVRRLTLA